MINRRKFLTGMTSFAAAAAVSPLPAARAFQAEEIARIFSVNKHLVGGATWGSEIEKMVIKSIERTFARAFADAERQILLGDGGNAPPGILKRT